MRNRQLGFLAVSTLVLAIITLSASLGGATRADAYSVATSAYTIGTVVVNPSHATVGTSVTLTGTGQIPKADLTMSMGGKFTDGQNYYAKLGNTTADGSGNWTFTFTVPASVTRESDNATIPIFTAGWPVGGATMGSDGGIYDSYNYLDVQAAAAPGTTTTTSTDGTASPAADSSFASSALPNTGAKVIGFMLAGISMISFGALGLRLKREARAITVKTNDDRVSGRG